VTPASHGALIEVTGEKFGAISGAQGVAAASSSIDSNFFVVVLIVSWGRAN